MGDLRYLADREPIPGGSEGPISEGWVPGWIGITVEQGMGER